LRSVFFDVSLRVSAMLFLLYLFGFCIGCMYVG